MGKVEQPETFTFTNVPAKRKRGRILATTGLFLGVGWILWSIGQTQFGNEHQVLYSKSGLENKDFEELFLSIPSGKNAHSAAIAYADHAHVAGTSEDFEDAKRILKFFQTELGIRPPRSEPIFPAGTPKSRAATISLTEIFRSRSPTAWIDVYYPEMDKPLEQSLDLFNEEGQSVLSFDLAEDGDPLDEVAHELRDAVPAWHGYSADGEVEGQLIYVNYGTKEDYDELVESGANFTGKIAIARYGQIARGLKIKGAEELGAAGVLIFSDPRDDGYVTVENGYAAYPHGPARNPTAIERGSVMFLTTHPGDPTTPGYPAYENAKRQEPTNVAKIPSLPISWQNAGRLLEEIGEVYAKDENSDGRRKLSGKSSVSKIRLVNHVKYEVIPIWNAMAAIPGHIRDEVVILGCHRDAWVAGAADPISGTAALHEIVRAYGTLLKEGWKPLRTIVIASWDGEEHGLLGSTEYGEDFASWISDHVVAYINVDVSSAGSAWQALGTPSLAHLIKSTALDVPHPTTPGRSLWDARNDDGPFHGPDSSAPVDVEFLSRYEESQRRRRNAATEIGPLGSGSDFTVFLQRLGIPSADQGFGYTPHDAVYHYHSIYDTVRWQEEYADPGYDRHIAVARHLGLMVMRLADSIIVPLNTTQYALELDDYLDKIENLVSDMDVPDLSSELVALRSSIAYLQIASMKLDQEKVAAEENFKDALSKLPWTFDAVSEHHCTRNLFPEVVNWIRSIFGLNENYPVHWASYLSADIGDILPRLPKNPILEFIKAARRVSSVNKKLIAFERGFLSESGVTNRQWYRHLGVAPGKWLGYGATTFPALSEAIQFDRNVTGAKYEARRLIELLDVLTEKTRP
ncbi:vacuolar protein sorting-associated protein 70 [Moniliophthora roreri MCA 2997]|uniref:Vacuolar protein sorting-associated protein 70 n=1 Tax=Moniliophthora roreri (strain MCA 2997) TaxID=1381753 RepID=V2Y852_MONRO|nr:vacuolar protein sorting-associated protein 70 [Moniliophthora roreri MCA 2997]